jgi:guanylate kinase
VIVVSAPSGAGKSTVLARVLSEIPALRFSVSHTTRPPRDGENEGIEYHFVDRAAFEALKREGQFLEWAEVHGHHYGTAHSEYTRAERDGVDLLLDLDVQGAAQARKEFRDAVTVFILPPSYAALEQRLRGRGKDDEATIRRRLDNARDEMRHYREYDYLIVNDSVDACAEALKCIIHAARSRTGRLEEPARKVLETFRRP